MLLSVDVGSTWTKGVLVDAGPGELMAVAQHPTTRPDVLTGVAAVRSKVEELSGVMVDDVRLSSSAGGGLRLAVVGYERAVTAEAGRLVALSAGGRVVHLATGRLNPADVAALRACAPDLVLLTGGTDGGNADVVVHNARRLAIARVPVPVVLAANADAAPAAAAELTRRGRRVIVAGNVLPRIGDLDPLPARSAIRAAFLEHVIGGKGLSRPGETLAGRTFAQLVRAPTPDAVLAGAELLAASPGVGDVLVVDVGGATTDVYSLLSRHRTLPGSPRTAADAVAGDAPASRTVEGDLGVRAGAAGLVAAAVTEGLLEPTAGNALLSGEPAADVELSALAVLIGVRRHGRPARPGATPRPLRQVGLVIGSGGVLRHADAAGRLRVLRPLLHDHAGGWAVPDKARLAVDEHALLFAAGLLAADFPAAAAALAGTLAGTRAGTLPGSP